MQQKDASNMDKLNCFMDVVSYEFVFIYFVSERAFEVLKYLQHPLCESNSSAFTLSLKDFCFTRKEISVATQILTIPFRGIFRLSQLLRLLQFINL